MSDDYITAGSFKGGYSSQPFNIPITKPKRYTLTDLRNDQEFVETSERFLSSIGKGDSVGDLFGYFRGADYNLADGIKAFSESKKFTEEQKIDYSYLRNKFNNAAIGGFGEWVRAGANVTKEMFTDPTMMASILFIPWSGGTSAVARIAAGKAVQTGLKMLAGKEVAKGLAKGAAKIGKLKKKTGLGRMADPVTGNAILTKNAMTSIASTEGLVYASGTDLVRQGIDVNTDRRDDINLAQTAAYGAIGAAIPLGLRGAGAGISKFQSSVANRRLARLEGGEDYKAGIFDKGLIKTDEIIEQLTPNLLRLTRFVQKPTSMFKKKMEDSEILDVLIRLFRYDTGKSILEDPAKIIKMTGWSFFENVGNRLGPKRERILKILQPLKEKGTITKPKLFSEEAFFKLPSQLYKAPKSTKQSYRKSYERISDPVNDALAYYLRTGRTTVDIKIDKLYWTGTATKRKTKRVSLEEAFNMTEKSTTDVVKAGDALKIVLREIRNDAKKAGIEIGRIKNYLPRGFNFIAVKKELANFKKGIEGKLVKEIRRAEKVKDDDTIIDILESILNPTSPVGTSQALLIATGKGAARGRKGIVKRIPKFTKPRQLKNIKDSNIDEYLDNNVENLMYDYIYSSSSYIQRKIDLGEDLAEFVQRYLNPIKAELKAKGKPLTRREENNLVDIYLVTTGQVRQIDSGFRRAVADLAIVGNQLSLLPLATITSLSEIAVPLVRGAGKTLTQKGKAGVKGEIGEGGIRTLWNTAGDYRKMWWNEVKKDIADGRPEALKELNRFGRSMNRAHDDRSIAMYGQGYGQRATTLQNKFFKVNLLHDWTRFVQVTSFNVGKSKIYENLHELATKKNISKSRKLRLSNQLRELNVDITAGKRWVKAGGKASGKFYNENFLRSAARYVDEVIMNPTAAANQKPLWHSMPSTRWAFGLMGFPTAFSNTVLKNAAREVVQDMRQHGLSLHRYGPTAGVISGVTTMLGIGLFGNTLRTGGRNLEEIEKGEETIFGELVDSAMRTGLMGPTEQLVRTQRAREYTNTVRAITSRFTGPAVDDAIRVWDNWVGPLSFAVDEIPGITLLRTAQPELYKALVKEARKYDQAMGMIPGGKAKEEEEEKSRPALLQFFEGGKISEDYPVPNVSKEPSERIDKNTGLPYEAEMERLGFAEGGEADDENIAAAYFNDNPNDLEELRSLIGYTPPPQEEEIKETKETKWNDVSKYMKEQFGEGSFKRVIQQFPYLLAAAPEDLGRLAALPYDYASTKMPLPNIGAQQRLETPFAFQRYTEWASEPERRQQVLEEKAGRGLFTEKPLLPKVKESLIRVPTALMPTIDKPKHTLGELAYMFLIDPTIALPAALTTATKAAPLFMAMTTTKGGIKTTPTKYVKPTTQELQTTYQRAELNELGLYSRAEQHLLDAPNDLKGQALVDYLYGSKRKIQIKKEEKQFLDLENKITADTTKEDLLQIIRRDRPDLYKTRYKADPLENIKATEEIQPIDPHDGINHSLDKVDDILDELVKATTDVLYSSRYPEISAKILGKEIQVVNYKKEHNIPVYSPHSTQTIYRDTPTLQESEAMSLIEKTVKNKTDDELYELAENISILRFEQNPYTIIKYEEAPEVYLYGNDRDGYQLMDETLEIPWIETYEGIGATEAKIKLKQYIAEHAPSGDLAIRDLPVTAFYEEYMLEGGRNYEEITINLRNPSKHMLEGEEISPHQWEAEWGEPIILDILTKERDVINKKTGAIKGETKHVDEIQADVHEAGRAEGYLTKAGQKEIEKVEKDIPNIINKLREDGKIKTHVEKGLTDLSTGIETASSSSAGMWRQRERLTELGEYIAQEKPSNYATYENWKKMVAEHLEEFPYSGWARIINNNKNKDINSLDSRSFSQREKELLYGQTKIEDILGLKTVEDIEAVLPEAVEIFAKTDILNNLGKGKVQDLPFKDIEEWAAIGIQAAIQEAASGGQKYVSFSNADIISRRYIHYNPDFYKLLYDKVIPRVGNKISKKLGAKTSIETIEVTPAIRWKDHPIDPSTELTPESFAQHPDKAPRVTEEMFTIELTPEALAKIEKEGIGPVFGFSKGGFVDTEKDPLHRLGFTGGGGIAIEDPLANLGFTGGGDSSGLMASVGVTSSIKKRLEKRKAKREGGGRIGFDEGEEVDNSLRLDEHKKSAVGWLGPIRNNITGKTMTELSIGGGKEGEPFYPLMNPLLNEKEIEHLQDNDYEGKAYKLQETEIGRQMLEKAHKFYLMRKREGLSPFYKDEVGPFQYGDRQPNKNGGSIKRKLQYREAKRNGGEISRQQYKFGDRVYDIMSRIFIGASTEDMKKLQSDTMKFIDDAVDRGEIEEHERTIYKDEKTGKKYKTPRTGEAYNSIVHGRLSVRYGDKYPQSRTGLQSKEFLQARNIMKGGIYDTSKGKKDNWWTEPSDALNNRAAFNILDKNPNITNEESDKQIISLYQTSREKTSRGEPLIIGEDFFLTKEDFINAGEPSVFGN